jgi:hypothetical protein
MWVTCGMKRLRLTDDALYGKDQVIGLLREEFQLATECTQIDVTKNVHGTFHIADLDLRRSLRDKFCRVVKADTLGIC